MLNVPVKTLERWIQKLRKEQKIVFKVPQRKAAIILCDVLGGGFFISLTDSTLGLHFISYPSPWTIGIQFIYIWFMK